MSALTEQPKSTVISLSPGEGRRVSIIGVPLGFACGTPGVDLGPATMRVARLNQRVAQLGYEVRDMGDLRIAQPQGACPPDSKARYLDEVAAASELIAAEVRKVMGQGEFPVILGGDHSV